MVQKTVEIVPQVQFLIEWWMCQLLMGVRISVSKHSDSKVQKIGAQDQYIGKIVCAAGSEIDREVSTTHDGMLASSSSGMG